MRGDWGGAGAGAPFRVPRQPDAGLRTPSHPDLRSLYARERAEQTLKLAARLAALVDDEPLPMLTALFDDHWMHVSPRIGVNAFAQNAAGEVLLLKRRDNGNWCMPGGISEMTDARFFPLDGLPAQMTASQASKVTTCGGLVLTGGSYVDPASSYDMDMPMRQRPGHELSPGKRPEL